MFVLFSLIAISCISVIVILKSQSISNGTFRRILRIAAAAILAVSVITLAVDFTAYIKGGIVETEQITIQQGKLNSRIEFFVINNKYWSVGENFTGHVMATAINPTNMEIRTSPIETILEYPVAIYHLPVSKFIVKMEYLTTNRHLVNKNFEFFTSGYIDDENKIMSYIALLSFAAMIAVVILTISKKRKMYLQEKQFTV